VPAADQVQRGPIRRLVRAVRADADTRAALAVALVAGLTYANAVVNGFTLDDDTVIQKNPLVHHLSACWRAFAHPYWPDHTPGGQYRPLAIVSFALDWAATAGSAQWMHAVNVVWHIGACLLVWRLLRELLPRGGALAGALYFAVQPVHVEAIASTVGRCDLMAAVFVLAGVLAHRHGRWTAVPLYAAAVASKESGAVMLGLVAASDAIFAPAPDGSAHAPGLGGVRAAVHAAVRPAARALRRRWRFYAGYLAVAAVYAGALALVFRHRPLVDLAPAWFHATVMDRWLTEARVVPEYVRLLVAPFELRLEYSPRVIEVAHTVTPTVALGLALVGLAVICAILAWRRAPAASFGIVWLAIAISPVSNILFASGVVLAERTLYLPSVGMAALVGVGSVWAWRRLCAVGDGKGEGEGTGGMIVHAAGRAAVGRRVALAAGAVVLAAFGVRSWTRTSVWHDDKRLLLTSLALEPESYRTHLRAAIILDHDGDWRAAEHEFAVARTLYRGDPYTYEGAAMVADMHDEFAVADRLYDSASLITPGLYEVYIKQARMRYRARDFAGAIRSARVAYLAERDSVGALNVLTGAAQQIGDFAGAEWAFRRGLADHPRDTALHRQYSWMLAARGDSVASRREAARAAGALPPAPGPPQAATGRAFCAPRGAGSGAGDVCNSF